MQDSTSVALESKKLCFIRCIYAVGLSLALQYFLLTLFLFFINFNILHPITWISETIGYIISLYTWISITPLMCAIAAYGILLGQSLLAVTKYYPSRFQWICGTVLRKIMFLGAHICVGLLTAWFYSRFLHSDYGILNIKCFTGYCVNSRYTFLLMAGMTAGIYYFIKENLSTDSCIEFPIVQQKKHVQIRSLLCSVLHDSWLKSFTPTICFIILYWITSGHLNEQFAKFFNIETDDNLTSLFNILTNFRLLFYTWLLSWHIISNMHLMDRLFSIMLSQEINFPIGKSSALLTDVAEVTLVQALALDKVPVIQNLAALDLYNLSSSKTALQRRHQIFSLSIPGGHPYNWNQLSGQCMSIICSFTEELASSVKSIATVRNLAMYTSSMDTNKEAADKILLRQYNENFGIRRMVMDQEIKPMELKKPVLNISNRVNDTIEKFNRQLDEALRSAFHSIPGLFYMFGESDGARTAFLLSNCQAIIWIAQGISGICANSLIEDKYGVVQNELPNIIVNLLKLKLELDKLSNINLNGKKTDQNLIVLKNAIKRSLYKICTVFGDYMRDLIDSPEDYKNLQCFLNYH